MTTVQRREASAGSVLAFGRLAEAATRRALGWRRLSEAFYGATEEWVAALLDGSVARDLRHAIAWLDSDTELFATSLADVDRFVRVHAATSPALVRELLDVDYAALFIGPATDVPAQPYESVWLDVDGDSGQHIFGRASTAAVQAAYASYGLARDPSHHDLSDHVATEEEFLCYLCELEAGAWSNGDVEEAKRLRASEQEFLSGHLARFAPQLCGAIQQTLPVSLYASLADYLLAFLTVDSGTSYSTVVGSIWPSGTP